MFIIQASNIHQGGGAVLLTDILKHLIDHNIKTKLFVDSRYQFIENQNLEIIKVKASVLSRFKVELNLAKTALKAPNTPILFLGNLPPLLGLSRQANLFFQNVILLDENKYYEFSFKTKLKHFVERIWLKHGLKYIKTVYVQSESVKKSFLNQFPNSNVKILAFSSLAPIPNADEKIHDFVYVATSDPHKNHFNLIKAWIYLAEKGVMPKLMLTASNFSNEEREVFDEALAKGVSIEVKPNLSHKEVLKLYSSAKALIYPSLAESFGLPLLEAKRAGLPIIASELDYVRDLVEPVETFDPNSEVSIARAVQRYLNLPESEKTEVKMASDFINDILH